MTNQIFKWRVIAQSKAILLASALTSVWRIGCIKKQTETAFACWILTWLMVGALNALFSQLIFKNKIMRHMAYRITGPITATFRGDLNSASCVEKKDEKGALWQTKQMKKTGYRIQFGLLSEASRCQANYWRLSFYRQNPSLIYQGLTVGFR